MTESRGSALASLATLVLAFGAALLLHGWNLLPAPQNLLPLLLVYIGARGARHTERGARIVCVLVLAAGLLAQAAILQGLPDSELGLLRPLGAMLRVFEAVWGLFTRFTAMFLVVGGVLLLMHARGRRRAASTPAPPPPGGASPHAAVADAGGESAPREGADVASTPADGDAVDQFAVFSGVSRSVVSPAFRGGRLIAIFGGLDLDLTQADMARPEARLDVWSIFGGASITVPAGCEVVVEAVPIFGGVNVSGKRRPPAIAAGTPPPGGRLVVGGAAIFGGIDVES